MENFTREEYLAAHKFSANHKKELLQDDTCGCFFCCKIFHPSNIKYWIEDTSGTATCPCCGMDSVIGASSGYPITKEFLQGMNDVCFGIHP